jgi:hypothetical protein
MDNAFHVWWYMIWRSVLTGIGVYAILAGIRIIGGIDATNPLSDVFSAIAAIALIVIQVYYLKLAINRDYKGFRVSTTTTNSVG